MTDLPKSNESSPPAESPELSEGSLSAAGDKTLAQKVLGQWPLAIVLAGTALGFVIVAFGHWRLGCTGIGAAITLGGLLRFLPGDRSGLLAVRTKIVDIILLLGVGIGIMVLAWIVPPSRG